MLIVLEVLLVGKKTRFPDPLCIPAVVDVVNDAVDSVVPRGFGIPLKVAAIVRWLISLPPHICIPELVIDNHYSKVLYW